MLRLNKTKYGGTMVHYITLFNCPCMYIRRRRRRRWYRRGRKDAKEEAEEGRRKETRTRLDRRVRNELE